MGENAATDGVSETGVVGLGGLGVALARHLTAVEGRPILGMDVDEGRCKLWQQLGGGAVGSLEQMVGVQRVVVAISDGEAAIDTAMSLARRDEPPEVYVLSTLAPDVAARFDASGEGLARCWHVPVTGGEIGALRGQLVAIAPDAVPEDAERFLYRALARRVVRVATARQAAVLKLLGNVLISYQFAGLAAAMEVGTRDGLKPDAILEVLASGSSGSPALAAAHDYAVAGLEKDLELLGVDPGPVSAGDGPHALRRVRRMLHGRSADR